MSAIHILKILTIIMFFILQLLCNGPGTCIPICGAVFLFKVTFVLILILIFGLINFNFIIIDFVHYWLLLFIIDCFSNFKRSWYFFFYYSGLFSVGYQGTVCGKHMSCKVFITERYDTLLSSWFCVGPMERIEGEISKSWFCWNIDVRCNYSIKWGFR